jgi:hypothetical protein
MLKVSTFAAENELGYTAVPLFGPADSEFEKRASASLLPPVLQYIESLTPRKDSQYVLVNALAAGEYFGSNINGDHFPEAALIHCPKGWTGNPLVDKALAKDWPYGFPTFYNAHPFAHHRNKDPSRAYGEVELALWNDLMKRVELVVRVDYDKCVQFGGIPVWDKLVKGQHPDVSMGSKVPFDTSSITLDWDLYRKAQGTFNPKRHKHPGIAVLEFHKKLKAKDGKGIPGVSITRDDYDDWCKKYMNRILPDGRKVFVWNDYPRFFDISFVFIGADRTAKTMVYIYQAPNLPSVKVAEALGYVDLEERIDTFMEKAASVPEENFIQALVKGAEHKRAEIEKQVVPSQMASKAIPVLTKTETDLPDDLINAMASKPLDEALSTSSGLCMVIKPREFQRITLIRMGKKPLADAFDDDGILFPKTDEVDEKLKLGPEKFLPALAKALSGLFDMRTAMAPAIERRVVVAFSPEMGEVKPSSHSSDLLRKIGAAYNAYRGQLLDMAPHAQSLIEKTAGRDSELLKVASADPEDAFTHLSYLYLRDAYLDELPLGNETGIVVQLS